MEWTELILGVPTADTEAAEGIALLASPLGFYTEDYSTLEKDALEIAHIDLIDEELLARDRTRSLLHLYLSPADHPAEAKLFLTERLKEAGIDYTLSCCSCREEDWANNWKAYFKPQAVGKRLFIRPIWEKAETPADRVTLNIEPGAAFGTGTHDTTRLCLETLDEIITPGKTVLDIGCGSGILAIASLLLGAKSAVGVDIDPLAVKTAAENGKMNGLSEPRLRFLCGDLADRVTGRYSVVVANIVADVIMAFCQTVPNYLEKDGLFLTSGIIDTREAEVVCALENAGFHIKARNSSGGWVSLLAAL